MAKKATPRESCVFCEAQPCTCVTTSREKQIRQALTDEDDQGKEAADG